MAASTGICRSAHSIRRTPSGVSARSLTSCLMVVAMSSLFSVVFLRDEKPLVLSAEPDDERNVVERDVEAASELRQAAEELQVVLAVAPVARRAPLGHHE